MLLTEQDYDILAQVREGRTAFPLGPSNDWLRDKLQRLYMAGWLEGCEEKEDSIEVGGLSPEGIHAMSTR